MKKITTNGRSFGTAQSLTRQELKNVQGGVIPNVIGTCEVTTECNNRKTSNVASLIGSVKCTGKKCSRDNLSVTCDGITTWC